MKAFASFVIIFSLAALLASCAPPNDSAPLSSSAEAYFFQSDMTQIYTYSQESTSQIDTFSYQPSPVDPVHTYNTYFQLKNTKAVVGNDVLYYFKNEQSTDGSMLCLLANSPTDQGYVALKGILDLGATWYADAAQNIQATVVGKYVEYYLPGREVHYTDVVVVKYSDKRASADNYVVRYFARGYGLIFELSVTGPSTQVADLQLLSRQSAGSSANPDLHHDHWYDANGRTMANMRRTDELDR